MPLLSLFLVLVVIGVVLYCITTYAPIDPGIKRIIQIVGILIAVLYVLNAFGIIGSLSHVRVPSVK